MAHTDALAPHAVACDDERATMCSHALPGHAAYAMQFRIASATPRAWVDAVVESVRADGWVRARDLLGTEALEIWRHDGFEALAVGDPIAVHRHAGLVAVAGTTTSALIH